MCGLDSWPTWGATTRNDDRESVGRRRALLHSRDDGPAAASELTPDA